MLPHTGSFALPVIATVLVTVVTYTIILLLLPLHPAFASCCGIVGEAPLFVCLSAVRVGSHCCPRLGRAAYLDRSVRFFGSDVVLRHGSF